MHSMTFSGHLQLTETSPDGRPFSLGVTSSFTKEEEEGKLTAPMQGPRAELGSPSAYCFPQRLLFQRKNVEADAAHWGEKDRSHRQVLWDIW